MPWTKVGEVEFNIVANSTDQDVTLPGSPIEGDIVIYAHAADQAVSPGVQTAGYTDIETDHSAIDPGHDSGWKQLGSTPDTLVTFQQTSGNEQTAGVLQVWRGADATTPLDAGPASAAGTGNPDSPEITTVTDGALVFSLGMLDDLNIADSITAPTGYTDLLAHDNTSSVDNACSMMASFEKASAGAENPGAFGASGSDPWDAATIAFRPSAAVAAIPDLITAPYRHP